MAFFSTFGKYIDEKCEESKRLPPKPEHELSVMEQLMRIDKDLAFAMSFDMFMAGIDTVRLCFHWPTLNFKKISIDSLV